MRILMKAILDDPNAQSEYNINMQVRNDNEWGTGNRTRESMQQQSGNTKQKT